MTHPYGTREYVRSLDHLGEAFEVPEWGGAVVSRRFGTNERDAAGPYPLAMFEVDADLSGGLERLRAAGFVSVTLVVDEYHRPSRPELEAAFDFVRPFKTHHVVDRTAGEYAPSRHHRYEIRRGRAAVRVEPFELRQRLPDWIGLYDHLRARHGLGGVHAFSRRHHEALSAMPGLRAVGAFRGDSLVAAHLWAESAGRVHSHLAASTEEGYALGAAYAVNDASIRLFADSSVINLGGGAGLGDDPGDGLARFKAGFANGKARSYLCGKILDAGSYDRLCAESGIASTESFFPAYRSPARRAPGGT